MFGEIVVPRNCRAVVNGRTEDKTRFRVGRYVPLYFVDFTPVFRDVAAQARCKEGITHALVVTVRFAFPADNLARVLEDQGHSDRSRTLTVKVEDWFKSSPLLDAVKAAASRYIREASFGDLAKADKVFRDLAQAIQTACADAKLAVKLESSEITHKMPSDDELAEIGAAGFDEVAKHFREAREQIPKLKADVEIAKLNEEDRKKKVEADLAEMARKRDEDAKKRNSDILELAATLQFEYDMKRLEESKQIAAKESELADLKKTEEEAARQKRSLDTQIDLDSEKARAKIRSDEKAAIFSEAVKLLAGVAAIPAPDLSQVRTLVTAANPATGGPRDMVGDLMWAWLSRVLDLSGPEHDQKKVSTKASG